MPVDQLTEEQADHELARLAVEILEHDTRYWEEGAPTLSDAEYNVLKQRNAEIESHFPHLIRENSPSLRAELDHAYWSAKAGLNAPTSNEVPIQSTNAQKSLPTGGVVAEDSAQIVPKRRASRAQKAPPVARVSSSLEDLEVALIKAMLLRGMRNAEIQFYFNRPDRRVNSGRITEIKRGSRGTGIDAASDAQLDQFLSKFTVSTDVPPPPAAPLAPAPSTPSEEEQVVALFRLEKSGLWRLAGGETDGVECKREVNPRKLAPIVRAMAGMANNRGGLILLGVEDKSGLVVGLPDDEFERLDPVKLTSAAQAHLQPVPSFTKGVVRLGDLRVGYVNVARCLDRPVIVFSPGDRMENGAVFYRYPAETAAIRFGEFRSLLDERDARRFRELAAATQRIAEIGVQRAAILNTADGRIDMEGSTRLVLDAALLDQINFIREGEFRETEGAPTLKVVGEIATVDGAKHGAGRRLITDEDVLRNFLDQETVLEPVEYIRFAVAASDRAWPPIFYFAAQAGLSSAELAGLIEGVDTTKKQRRKEAALRASGLRTALERPKGSPARRLEALLAGDLSEPVDHKAAEHLAIAIQGLPNAEAAPLPELLALVKRCWSLILEAQRFPALSHVFRAAARLDEIFFRRP
ncbi:RNA-binding domain-containing protein [Phenylobacterium sp.]|uniref:AlbA family DNA-binding domain-containing protein n=1 Tax=Phenylobacterium sp. TaxID=1871053 RepID=UPI0035B4C384